MGSGKLIKRAIEKYGIDNFSKEYLGIYNTEKEMNLAEKIFVVIDLEVSYNICSGGQGGFGYINENGLNDPPSRLINLRIVSKQLTCTEAQRKASQNNVKKASKSFQEQYAETGRWSFSNRHHSDETKKKMSETKRGKKTGKENSQFGKCWITNGIENKIIKKEELNKYIDIGFYKGRV